MMSKKIFVDTVENYNFLAHIRDEIDYANESRRFECIEEIPDIFSRIELSSELEELVKTSSCHVCYTITDNFKVTRGGTHRCCMQCLGRDMY
ncbi:hypothetical protein [Bacillus cereus]|uniref:hypothetical protein n=1 Tax=Bacillus cereus TaxID=1396 RepID=UPI000994602E|nr:hypothetical protein [Bacillus cereus]OOQ91925.1 hypothetical protein BW898_26665 [Bacillus cereus]